MSAGFITALISINNISKAFSNGKYCHKLGRGGALSMLSRCAPSVCGDEYLNKLIIILFLNEAVVPFVKEGAFPSER